MITWCCLCCLGVVQAQLKSLDSSAYKDWKTITSPLMAGTGHWVMYSLLQGSGSTRYFVNTQTGQSLQLDSVRDVAFFAKGNWISYTVSRKSGDSLFFWQPDTHQKIYWPHGRPQPLQESARLVAATIGKPGRFTVYNLEKHDSIAFEEVPKYQLYDHDQRICFQRKDTLLDGPLKGPYRVVYKGPLSDYTFHPEKKTGCILSDSCVYTFTLSGGPPVKCIDFRDIQLPAPYHPVLRAYDVSPGTSSLLLDVRQDQAAPPPPAPPLHAGFELELWTWNEGVSQRRQRKGVYNKTPQDDARFIYHPLTKQCVQVLTENAGQLMLPEGNDYRYAFLLDSHPYLYSIDWKYSANADIYLVDVYTGARVRVATNSYDYPQWSPDGRHALLYDAPGKQWLTLDTTRQQFVPLPHPPPYPVYDEDYDMAHPPLAYGLAGWLNGGSSAVLYDRYDLWVADLSGQKPTYALTREEGRAKGIQLRLQGADYAGLLNLDKPITLRSFNEHTKSAGIYRYERQHITAVADQPAYSIKILATASDGKSVLFTKESYQQSPDLWWGSANLRTTRQLTRLNPQQQQYNWGTVKVVSWKNFAGNNNEGLLYLPQDYDSTKSYPMIVNFYETHAHNLHAYITPQYPTSILNIVTYVSNGYIVFQPDVHYTLGDPGESAYNAVVSGTEAMVARGIADKKRIGLQGHSWAGYQAAYVASRTNIFACASPCAAVVNMTYNYSAIRASGAPCMFLYESGQSRMGGSLWEMKEKYIQNSTIFRADSIHTPLLIFHNDKDGAVAFTQGLDLFLAMRRLQRPAWLLNYKGEGHTLDNEAAQRDYAIRMQQFFDHYLKQQPMPLWMKEGISIDERKYTQKYTE
ncbi:S9 family peptidase [Chitinophaga costaii]|nr:prolyl oligopeptidase family serine peptidase [Chitinophaga costaii]